MSFYDRFTYLCERLNTSPSYVAAELGLSNSIITYWRKGAMPKAQTLKKIADYFDVPVDYLVDYDMSRFLNDDQYAELFRKNIRVNTTPDAEFQDLERKLNNQTMTNDERQRYKQLVNQSTNAAKNKKMEFEARLLNILNMATVLPDDAIDDLMLFIEFLEMKADKERKNKQNKGVKNEQAHDL